MFDIHFLDYRDLVLSFFHAILSEVRLYLEASLNFSSGLATGAVKRDLLLCSPHYTFHFQISHSSSSFPAQFTSRGLNKMSHLDILVIGVAVGYAYMHTSN